MTLHATTRPVRRCHRRVASTARWVAPPPIPELPASPIRLARSFVGYVGIALLVGQATWYILMLAACAPTAADFQATLNEAMRTPAQRCHEAQDIIAGIQHPTLTDTALGVAACAQLQL